MTLFTSKENKAKLKALEENYAIIRFKPDGTIIDANKNFLDTLGYKLDEIQGKHHSIFCDKNYCNSNEYKTFWKSLNEGETKTSEFKRFKKNNEAIYIQASYTPIKNKNQEVYEVVKFAQDITQRKIKTLDYTGQVEAISKSQAVIEFNMQGVILNANENFLNTLGYKLSEIQGKHHSIFCEESYKNSKDYKDFWAKLNSGQYDSGIYLRLGKNNKKVWIQATYNPILDVDNKPFKVVKYATDITRRKNLIFDIDENVQKLTASLNNLSSAADSMSKGAQITKDGSQEISVSITQINEAVNDVSSKIQTMLNSIKEISITSSKAEEITKIAQEQSKETTNAMMKLNEESEKIGETITLITQIAFQTNILSLNAAVEAATAGEAGKGFAVVAQEVRNLANRSDDAAKEITQAVELIQTLVKNSLESISNIDGTIEEITSMSTNISSSMSKQENISKDLANIAQEASQGVNEVTNSMNSVSNSAQNSGEKAKETLSATNELINVSSKLISILQQLK
ncbi:chemotaxis protein [Malaciobacter halophilus]|uniref:Chemotaxis protein n=2 Tax=Malaciobacter halophilus TaxID=197482 RepID=A0A2N1J058_9BACT|nr:PAS domain-containing methyl-accepting chemotaxis protein [Malaciobacter halophilus]AXH10387.1 PAS sensor-containing MCP-domain signal transduction protein [Malaciobacter halophilus]PKI79933.1 chemotaxis protein [Malaciobacter halophilus]